MRLRNAILLGILVASPAAADPVMSPLALLYFKPGTVQLERKSRGDLRGFADDLMAHWSYGWEEPHICAGRAKGARAERRLGIHRAHWVATFLRSRGARPVKVLAYRQCAGLGEMTKPSVLLFTVPGWRTRQN
jgi:hypothetical protein